MTPVTATKKEILMNRETTEIYIPDDLYEALVNRLVDVVPLLGSRDDLVLRLGEVARIWPERVKVSDSPQEFLHAA